MNKKLIVLNILIVIILMFTTSVYAQMKADYDLKVNKDLVKAGDEFTVTLSLKDVSGTTEGVKSLEGYINIDKNVIEEISFDSIVKSSDNTVKIGDQTVKVYDAKQSSDNLEEDGIVFNGSPRDASNNSKIVIDLNKGITEGDIITLKFKVKNNIENKKYENVVTFKDFDITSGSASISDTITKTVGIEVSVASSNTTNEVNNTVTNKVNNTVTNKVNNTVTNKVNNSVANKTNTTKTNTSYASSTNDNTTSPSILPKTGIVSILLKAILGVAIIGIIVYVKYKRYKEI